MGKDRRWHTDWDRSNERSYRSRDRWSSGQHWSRDRYRDDNTHSYRRDRPRHDDRQETRPRHDDREETRPRHDERGETRPHKRSASGKWVVIDITDEAPLPKRSEIICLSPDSDQAGPSTSKEQLTSESRDKDIDMTSSQTHEDPSGTASDNDVTTEAEPKTKKQRSISDDVSDGSRQPELIKSSEMSSARRNSASQEEITGTALDRNDLKPGDKNNHAADEDVIVIDDVTTEERSTQSKRRVFGLTHTDIVLVFLPVGEELALYGKLLVGTLCGQVRVLGYVIKSSRHFYPVFSPESNSLLTIESVQSAKSDLLPARTALLNFLKKEVKETQNLILNSLKPNDAILLVRPLACPVCRFVTSLKPFSSLFQKCVANLKADQYLDRLGLTSTDAAHHTTLKIPQDFTNVAQSYNELIAKGSQPVFAVCGGRNVGKSTLGRYIMNNALNICDTVAYLECDIGQTEFTPSGCVSLNLVTKPLLGPPFTHQRTPHRMIYFGSLNGASNPGYYLSCVRRVLDDYHQLKPKPPLVVNTMGWSKGLGVKILVTVLRLVVPDIVVQINSTSAYKNLPTLTPEFLLEHPVWINAETRNRLAPRREHKLHEVASLVHAQFERDNKYKPPDHRSLALLGYLSKMQNLGEDNMPLGIVTPCKLAWHDVAVHVITASVPNSQIMYALNASVVGLCIVDPNIILKPMEDCPGFLSSTPNDKCLGFGIIRAIDPEEKVFYIITPLPQEKLKNVNCLLAGDLSIPEQVLLNQVASPAPYIDTHTDVIGAKAIKPRRHLFRHTAKNGARSPGPRSPGPNVT